MGLMASLSRKLGFYSAVHHLTKPEMESAERASAEIAAKLDEVMAEHEPRAKKRKARQEVPA